MPSANDFIEIIMEGLLFGQQIINVRQFQITEIVNDGDFEDILDEWEDTILPGMASEQTGGFEWTRLTVNNITDPDEFAQRDVSVGGALSGDALPPHTAASIKLQRGSKITRNGYMRFAGLVELAQADGLLTISARANLLADVGFLIGDTSCGTAPDTITVTSVIMGRNSDGSYDLLRWQYPTSVSVQEVVTTQRSRKIGVGR